MNKCLKALTVFVGLWPLSVIGATGDPNFEHTYFTGSGQCADCHNGLTDSQGNDISIETHWGPSMMANSSRDPYWQAKVASELKRDAAIGGADLSGEIHDRCSRCHAPMANDAAQKDGVTPLIFDEGTQTGFLNITNAYFDAAMDGVSCTLCHQITDNGKLGTLAGVSGNFEVADYVADGTARIDRPIYAQYSGVSTQPMRNNVAFTPQFGAHISTSEMCASCHDLKTPFVDSSGNLVPQTPEDEFPEQMVYSEWNNSAYADTGATPTSCQDCHMPKLNEAVKIANQPPNLAARNGFAMHSMLGANTVMMDLLNRNRADLGVLAPAADFNSAIAANRDFLKQAAKLTIVAPVQTADQLSFKLRVENQTGHKFPSGYPSRRAYLYVKVTDENNNLVFESGKLNADGSIVGVATDVDSTTVEPHYDVITTADQVQVYEPIMQDTDGNVTHTLLRAATYRKDNRLLPVGFDKANAPADVAVHGAAFNDANFIGGSDEVTYQVDLTSVPDTAKLTITAELRYQPLSFGHLQDLFLDTSEVQVSSFKAQFEDGNTIRSELVASASLNVNNSQLDIDASGTVDALTDGVLFIRYALGLTGNALVLGAVSEGCSRCEAVDIANYLQPMFVADGVLDVDGNSDPDALTDGVLMTRWALGLNGVALTQGAVGEGCRRCTADDIINYLESL